MSDNTHPVQQKVSSSGLGLNITDPKSTTVPATLNQIKINSSNTALNTLNTLPSDTPTNSNKISSPISDSSPSFNNSCISSSSSLAIPPSNLQNGSYTHQHNPKVPSLLRRQSSHHTIADIAHKVSDMFSLSKSGSPHNNNHNSSKNPTTTTAGSHSSSPFSSPSTSRSGSTTSLNKLIENLHSHTRPSLSTRKSNSSLARSSSKDNFSILLGKHRNPTSTTNLTRLTEADDLKPHHSLPKLSPPATCSSSTPVLSQLQPKVKETHYVHVDYNPITRKRVLNTYEIMRDLGRGQHGKVKLAKDTDTNELVAIKIVDRAAKPKLGRTTRRGSTQEEKIRREIAIMKKCSHPHVVKLIEVMDAENSRKIYMVLEYLEKGEIHWQKKDEETDFKPEPLLTLQETKSVFREVVSGVEYLHHQGIIHRDIKPSNLLVSKDNVVKISDFGVSFAANLDGNNDFELAKTAGTPAFLAPELCKTDGSEAKVTYKIDIWALGVTLYCLIFGKLPFDGETEFALFDAINKDELEFPNTNEWKSSAPLAPHDFNQVTDLIKLLLRKDPFERIEIDQIKEHPFFLEGLTRTQSRKYTSNWNNEMKIAVTNKEVDEAVIGIGDRLKKKLSNAFKMTGLPSIPKNHQNLYIQSLKAQLQTSSDSESSSCSLPASGNPNMRNASHLSMDKDLSSLPRPESSPLTTDPRFLHRGSISASIESSTGSITSSASLSETREHAEAGSFSPSNDNNNIDSNNHLPSSALFKLAGIINKDNDLKPSLPVNESETTLTTESKSLSPKHLQDSSIYTEDELNHQLPKPIEDSAQKSTIPAASPYDFREELKKSEMTKGIIPVVPSFASLDSYYDECLASDVQPYTAVNAGSYQSQRSYNYQPSRASSSSSSSYRYSSSIDYARQQPPPQQNQQIRSNGVAFKDTNYQPLHSGMPSAVSIPDFLKPTDMDPITPSVTNNYYNTVANSRRPPALANNFKPPTPAATTTPPLPTASTFQTQSSTTTPPPQAIDTSIASQRRDSRKVVFSNGSEDSDSSEDEGPITFSKQRLVNQNQLKRSPVIKPQSTPRQPIQQQNQRISPVLYPNKPPQPPTQSQPSNQIQSSHQRHHIYGKKLPGQSIPRNSSTTDDDSDTDSNSETELMLTFGGNSSSSPVVNKLSPATTGIIPKTTMKEIKPKSVITESNIIPYNSTDEEGVATPRSILDCKNSKRKTNDIVDVPMNLKHPENLDEVVVRDLEGLKVSDDHD